MAATPIVVNTISRAGAAPVAEAAGDNTNGNSFPNNGATWIEATNGGGSAATLTVAYANKVDGQTVPAKSFPLAASAKTRIGPFPAALFGNTVVVTPSAASVTLVAYQLGS
jgi:hypothetical protein